MYTFYFDKGFFFKKNPTAQPWEIPGGTGKPKEAGPLSHSGIPGVARLLGLCRLLHLSPNPVPRAASRCISLLVAFQLSRLHFAV